MDTALRRARRQRSPRFVEVLRLLVVVFAAGVGLELARMTDENDLHVGPYDAVVVGVVLACAVGYVVGGVLGRTTLSAADRVTRGLRDVPAETIVAGLFGGFAGLAVAAVLAWPLFLIAQAAVVAPLFGFVAAVLAYLGFQVGTSHRDGVLAVFGARAGLATRGLPMAALPRVVDSSVAIDGRVLDVVRAGFLHGRMLVVAPVVAELQGLADAGDDLRRGRGRRGLEVLEALRHEPGVEVEIVDDEVPAVPEVDAKLVRLCLDRGAVLLTLDTNLAKAAGLAGVRVMNLHALALALRPPVVAGEDVEVALLKSGKEAGQAVGYLDDGSMVVVERARGRIGTEVSVRVTSVLTTANGRLVFARLAAESPIPGPTARPDHPTARPDHPTARPDHPTPRSDHPTPRDPGRFMPVGAGTNRPGSLEPSG